MESTIQALFYLLAKKLVFEIGHRILVVKIVFEFHFIPHSAFDFWAKPGLANTVSKTLTFPDSPPRPSNNPRSLQESRICNMCRAFRGTLVSLSCTRSTPIMRPFPRTSPTMSNWSLSLLSWWSRWVPICKPIGINSHSKIKSRTKSSFLSL